MAESLSGPGPIRHPADFIVLQLTYEVTIAQLGDTRAGRAGRGPDQA